MNAGTALQVFRERGSGACCWPREAPAGQSNDSPSRTALCALNALLKKIFQWRCPLLNTLVACNTGSGVNENIDIMLYRAQMCSFHPAFATKPEQGLYSKWDHEQWLEADGSFSRREREREISIMQDRSKEWSSKIASAAVHIALRFGYQERS